MSTYDAITDRIIASLEAGVIPWRKEWRTTGSSRMPHNLSTGKPYRGVNLLTLMCSDFASSAWLTYIQAREMGAQVRKGSKGTPIVFWSCRKGKDEKTGEEKALPFLKQYTVFNIEQIDGLQPEIPFDAPAFNPIESAESVVSAFMASASHPSLGHGGSKAYYSPLTDHVQLPQRHDFTTPEGYYATAFHEFAHATGHSSRLARKVGAIAAFGDEDYSDEELVAEFSAAFLAAESGIANDQVLTNSTAYIQGWLRKLRNDKAIAVFAAQRAQKAADFILGRQPNTTDAEVSA